MADLREGEGLRKLTEYLTQTRRQAEAAVDALNGEIAELQETNKRYLQLIDQLENERDYFKHTAEQLKLQNSTKWKFQERDDWKNLVESVQRDRSRLQEECIVLSTELEQARAEIADLQQQVRDREAESRAQATLSAAMHDKETQEVSLEEKEEDLTEGSGRKSSGRLGELSSGYMSGASPPVSPSIDSAKYNAFTPKAMAKQLKMELMRTHSQLVQERQQAEAVRLQQTSEINRLREELNAVRPLLQGSAFQNGSLQDRSRSGTVDSITISGSNSVGNSSGTGWFSFFGYLFGSSGDTQPKSGMSAVLKL